MSTEVAYFAGCTADYSEPEIGKAVVEVLEALGMDVLLPEQHCCSIAAWAAGRQETFRKAAASNIRSLAASGADVVTACSTCAAALKHDYPRLLRTPEAGALAARTYDIMEYLVRLGDQHRIPAFRPVQLRLAYHAPCHLVALGGDLIEKRLAFLRSIPALEISHIDRGCCGMGGTFGMKGRNYRVSMEIGRALFEAIKELQPDMVISECPGCRAQIAHGTGLPTVHPITIVSRALVSKGTPMRAPAVEVQKVQ